MRLLSLTLATLLFPTATPPVLVENMQLSYKVDRGEAQLARAQFVLDDKTWDFTNARFDVSATEGGLLIERPEDGFSYPLKMNALADVTAADARGVWVDFAPGRVIGSVQSARLEKGGDTTTLGRASINCRASARSVHPIDSCLNSGRVQVSSVGGSADARAVDISELDLNIARGKTNFSVRVGGIGKITGTGTTTHEAQVSTVKIKIDKVRLGILDITGQFFSQIKDLESESLRVQRPFIWVIYEKGSK